MTTVHLTVESLGLLELTSLNIKDRAGSNFGLRVDDAPSGLGVVRDRLIIWFSFYPSPLPTAGWPRITI